MTESGSPYDNAIAERVNGILKCELGLDAVFEDHERAEKAIDIAIKRYNKARPHLSCGYLTPNQAHKAKKPLIKLWKQKSNRICINLLYVKSLFYIDIIPFIYANCIWTTI